MKFLDTNGLQYVNTNINQKLSAYVSTERTINGHDMSDDVVLTASDVGIVDMQTLNNAVRSRISSKWRDGWPEIWSTPIVDTGRAGLAKVAGE